MPPFTAAVHCRRTRTGARGPVGRAGYDGAVVSIRVLPDAVVNRIAAGEVVERPASVVKELVENSLDAGATRVDVELKHGGRSLVRVADDGGGMSPDDALLALERHATSKLATASDLEHLTTLGFRGEALPSIAAVSRFVLHSAADPADGGLRVTVEGGRILGAEAAARPRGTTVEVRELFFNTPARRKFLHAPETELRHAQETVMAAALARPEVAFTFRHGERTLFELLPVTDTAERLTQVERRLEGSATRFEAATGDHRVWGLLALGRSSRRPQLTTIVNGRPVRDRLLAGAVRRVLREHGAGFGGARVVLVVELPHDQVDVNVHPAKAEVRFARAGAVFALVDRGLRAGIAGGRQTVPVDRVELPEGVGEPAEVPWASQAAGRGSSQALFEHPVYGAAEAAREWPAGARPEHPPATAGAKPGVRDTPFGRLIGQYRASFMLLEDDWGLLIVDQHVAHERVLYDRIRRRLEGAEAPSQRLLEPLLLEVDESRAAAVERVRELLGRAGLEVEAFGAGTLRVTALPPEADQEQGRSLVEELLGLATELDGVPERATEALADGVAASLACRAAIKINHALTVEEQRALLADLAGCDNPYRCPHGRPIVLRLSQEEMERRLGRR